MEKRFAILDENNILCFTCSESELTKILEDRADELLLKPLCLLPYGHPDSICKNLPVCSTFSEELSGFICPSPDPTYILNTDTLGWEPNPELKYDLHGDGKLYTYIRDRGNGLGPGWKPVPDPIEEDLNI